MLYSRFLIFRKEAGCCAACVFILENIQLQSPPEAHYTVYKLTDPEGKVYIGCTGQRVKRRWMNGRGYISQQPVMAAIRRYGRAAINKDILCEKLTKDGAEKLEKWFVEYYDSMNPEKGYNSFSGGSRVGGYANRAAKEKMSAAQVKLCESSIEVSSDRSMHMLRYFARCPERRKEIAAHVSNYLMTEEGRSFPECDNRPQPVLCVETGQVYPSQRAAERVTGLKGIHKVCSGSRSVSGGYHWRNL